MLDGPGFERWGVNFINIKYVVDQKEGIVEAERASVLDVQEFALPSSHPRFSLSL